MQTPAALRHCFTYGTLMCADIMAAVCGHPVRGEAATACGFARHPVRGEAYPGMRPRPGQTVDGVLYRNLAPSALERLDAFEGAQYERKTITVRLPDGSSIDADSYVFRSTYRHLLEPGPWDFQRFLRTGRPRFVNRYVGYARI